MSLEKETDEYDESSRFFRSEVGITKNFEKIVEDIFLIRKVLS